MGPIDIPTGLTGLKQTQSSIFISIYKYIIMCLAKITLLDKTKRIIPSEHTHPHIHQQLSYRKLFATRLQLWNCKNITHLPVQTHQPQKWKFLSMWPWDGVELFQHTYRGHYTTNPNNALLRGTLWKLPYSMHCLIRPKMGHLMILIYQNLIVGLIFL